MEIERGKTPINDNIERKIQSILYTCMVNDEDNWYWYCRFNCNLYRCNYGEEGYEAEIESIISESPVSIGDSRTINDLDRNYENYIWIPEIGVININTGKREGADRNRIIGNAYFECAESLKALTKVLYNKPKEKRQSWR